MAKFQAGLDGVTFQSRGCKLLGGFYRAGGTGPRPTAVLLHGLPGVEKNLDIAYHLRDSGWNCLYFHYRGSWGSEGVYSLDGLWDDLLAAADWLQRQPSVDVDRLALVGHSLGGYLALTAGASEARFRVIAALCPLVSPEIAPLSTDMSTEFAGMLHGITGERLRTEWDALPPADSFAERLQDRKVLILTGRLDVIFPPAHYKALKDAVPTIEWHEFPDGDHVLSRCRGEAVRRTVDWLTAQVESGAFHLQKTK